MKGKPAKPVIRNYKAADKDSCRALWIELTIWHRHIYSDQTIGGSNPARHFDLYLRNHGPKHIWVAEVGGEIVGMAGLIHGGQGYELEPLIVSTRHRGETIGTQLVMTVIQAARQKGATMLSVRPVARNDPAIRFFRNLGFDTLGHIELFMDFTPAKGHKWKGRKTMAGRHFRY